ncbi:hypothetical protein OAL54_01495 [Gammaproteobacteria bacterium]|nr:hypothetical protein [Gammaproteobacteria bacterium]MDC0220392.1 hypothetical protein [Gammaproteobacteria bacterium]|tara:strand:- start:190 stop:684 length:495 start_codon:yes stop_codon:yes gene_type:complete
MNWEAVGAIGDFVGALAVIITLAYLAIQVRHARDAAADTNRLERSKGVRDIMLATALDRNFVETLTKGLKLSDYYEKIGAELSMSSDEAASFDWAMLYWFWLHWGQYASTTKASDVEELRNLISIFYSNPGVRLCWDNSPWAKPVLEKDFVNFVEEILVDSERK